MQGQSRRGVPTAAAIAGLKHTKGVHVQERMILPRAPTGSIGGARSEDIRSTPRQTYRMLTYPQRPL